MKAMKTGRYKHKVIETEDGKFDSKSELERWKYLKSLEDIGVIRDLQRQVTYEVIPKQTKKVVVHMKTKDKVVEKFLEHPVVYVSDFSYDKIVWDSPDKEPRWEKVVEDVKGATWRGGRRAWSSETPEFRIKKKLMLYVHGIEVKVVTKPTQEI